MHQEQIHWKVIIALLNHTGIRLRTAAALHSPIISGHITAETLLFLLVKTPFVIERVERHGHDAIEDFALTLFLDSLDQFVKDPGSGHELQKCQSAIMGHQYVRSIRTLGFTFFMAA